MHELIAAVLVASFSASQQTQRMGSNRPGDMNDTIDLEFLPEVADKGQRARSESIASSLDVLR